MQSNRAENSNDILEKKKKKQNQPLKSQISN